jgi:flagellar hook-associated protein 1 FlgK
VDVLVQEGKNTRTVTRGVAAGEVGGLIQIRDTVIKPALEELNKIAHAFAQAVNQVHREGISTDGGSGRDLFEVPEDGKGAAQGLYLNREVDGVDKIAVGYSLELPGDNRVALKMSEIQKALIVPAKGYSQNGEEITQAGLTLNDALTNWSGNIASVAQKENQLYSHQKSILEQLDNYHQTISGVNLEEEAIQMMQYQSVFNASAKVMKVGDELLQTILSLKP